MPFKDNTFDLVYSYGVLHHVKDMTKAIREVKRVMKPNGKAIIWLYGKNWIYYFFFPIYFGIIRGEFLKFSFDEIIHRHMEVKGDVPIVRCFNKKEMLELFEDFKIEKIRNTTGYERTLGNKFLKLNKIFCSILDALFPYDGWIVKLRKK